MNRRRGMNVGWYPTRRTRASAFAPTDLPGLVGWYESQPAHIWRETTATNRSTYSQDIVKRIDDLSGDGNHLVQSDTALSRVLTFDYSLALRTIGRNASHEGYLTAGSPVIDKQNFTVSFRAVFPSPLNYSAYWSLGPSGEVVFLHLSGVLDVFMGGSRATTLTVTPGLHTITVTGTAGTLKVRLDGVEQSVTALTAGTLTEFTIGAWKLNGSGSDATGFMGVVVSEALSADQVTSLETYLGTLDDSKSRLLVFDGNSYVQGATTSVPSLAFANLSPALLAAAGSYFDVVNYGLGGQDLDDMLADAVAQVDAVTAVARGSMPIVVVLECLNQVASGSAGAQVYAKAVEYCEDRKAAGAKVILFACPSYPATVTQSAVDACNALLSADFSVASGQTRIWLPGPGVTYADVFCDINADSRLGPVNATYRSTPDDIHPNDLGHSTYASDYVVPAVGLI